MISESNFGCSTERTSKMRRKIQVGVNKSCGMLLLCINKISPEDESSLHAYIFGMFGE